MMEEEEETLFDQEGLLGRRNQPTEEQSVRKKKIIKTGALTMSFFSMGLCVALAGTTLPDLGSRVDKDTEHMTFILVARSIGYLIGAGVGGVLSDFLDQQLIMFYVLVSAAVATMAVPWCTTLYALATLVGVQGTAIGVLDTGGNLFCIRLWGKQSAPYMQFLHFAFGVGAFLAPLIARPFLVDSVTEYSTNMSSRVLPFSTSTKHVRDLSYVSAHFEQEQLHLERFAREVETHLSNPTTISDNSSDALPNNFTTTKTTERPKKPGTVISKPLRDDLADSHVNNPKLKKIKTEPLQDKDVAEEEGDKKTTPSTDISKGNTNCTQTECPGNVTAFNQSSQNGTQTSDDDSALKSSQGTSSKALRTTPSTTTTTTSTPTTSTTTTTATTTTTTLSTSSATRSAVLPKVTDSSGRDDQSLNKPDKAIDETIDVDDLNTASTRNTTQGANDLVNAMFETLRNMSKIQFAYLIVGLFLFFNALYFVSLFYKDGKKCSYRPEPSHEDLIRPPDPKSFVASILTLLFFFFFFYVGMEQTFGILFTTFAVEYSTAIWTPAQAATIIAVFWGCVALGRGIGILIAHYFKAPCMMVLNLTITFIAGGILSFAITKFWYMLWLGTALLGLGMSSTFATTISWADSYYPLSGKATAVFVAGSGFGQMSIPVMTGYLYQNVDRMCLMYVVFGAGCTLCVIYATLQCVASCKGSLISRRSRSGFMMLGTAEDAGDSLDMDLIQAGGMGSVMENVRHRKQNGAGLVEDEAETTQLVELSD